MNRIVDIHSCGVHYLCVGFVKIQSKVSSFLILCEDDGVDMETNGIQY
jgi:hypothetical protein